MDSELSTPMMYKLYLEAMQHEPENLIVSQEKYIRIFKTDFDLHFHKPKKDQCDYCTAYNQYSAEEKKENEIEYTNHIKEKEQARERKKFFKEYAAKSDGKCVAATYDFQKGIPTPKGEASCFYYKRKLIVHNFTVYELVSKIGHNFMWDESISGTGASDVASCLIRFMSPHINAGVSEFHFNSDNCPGQNRNRFIYGFYVYMTMKHKIDITHTFLIKGHTQNEGDNVHACIENALKNKTLFVPNQVYDIVRNCKVRNPYVVYTMKDGNFFDFKVNFFSLLNYYFN